MNVHFVFWAKIFSFTDYSRIPIWIQQCCATILQMASLWVLSPRTIERTVPLFHGTDWHLHPFNHSGHTVMWRMFENNELSWITEYKPTGKKKLVGRLLNSWSAGERFVLISQFLYTTRQSVKHLNSIILRSISRKFGYSNIAAAYIVLT